MKHPSITVIGSGIGGLAAALSLLRQGFEVQIYEQADVLGEVGAGLQISPNACRILHRMGLVDGLASAGVQPTAIHARRWDNGRTLQRTTLAPEVESRFGAPYYHIHRADLLGLLAGAMPAGHIHLAHRLMGFVDHGDGVEVVFENGKRIQTDILIGADGIQSTVRRLLLGEERPRFCGCICYRGLVPAERLAAHSIPAEMQSWLGPGAHFVHYYVRGGQLVNMVAILDREEWTKESWSERGNVKDAIAAFAGWHPQVRGILEAVDETFVWGLYDRQPLSKWSVGRVTLLGDACHPMLPFMAQGAAQAIEDGAALAACLGAIDSDDFEQALGQYEALRRPRTSRMQALSSANKLNNHLPDGPAQAERDALMAQDATYFALDNVAWIFKHDAASPSADSKQERERVAEKPSFFVPVAAADQTQPLAMVPNQAPVDIPPDQAPIEVDIGGAVIKVPAHASSEHLGKVIQALRSSS